MEWGDIDHALDAFVLGNHHTLFAKSRSSYIFYTILPSLCVYINSYFLLLDGQAYTFKMAFSSNTSLEYSGTGGAVINA